MSCALLQVECVSACVGVESGSMCLDATCSECGFDKVHLLNWCSLENVSPRVVVIVVAITIIGVVVFLAVVDDGDGHDHYHDNNHEGHDDHGHTMTTTTMIVVTQLLLLFLQRERAHDLAWIMYQQSKVRTAVWKFIDTSCCLPGPSLLVDS